LPKRKAIQVHHTATHLLHAALRQILGAHVAQKGSLVNDVHLRFDFSHFSRLTPEQLTKVENLVNEKIRENLPVVIKEMSKNEAITLGAMALFGEKYGERVRVVIIDPKYSIELCGGTHAGATGELGLFKIKHETAVAAGVRRIEALAGKPCEDYVASQMMQLQEARELLKNPKELLKSIENILNENAELKKKVEKQEGRFLSELRKQLLERKQTINGINFIGEIIEASSAEALKKLCFDMRADMNNFVIVLAASIDGKASVVVSVDETLIDSKKLEAPSIIKQYVAPLIKGGGGGQKSLATAGGQETGNFKEMIEKVKTMIMGLNNSH
jgi:alanyl-tRNA synthetase